MLSRSRSWVLPRGRRVEERGGGGHSLPMWRHRVLISHCPFCVFSCVCVGAFSRPNAHLSRPSTHACCWRIDALRRDLSQNHSIIVYYVMARPLNASFVCLFVVFVCVCVWVFVFSFLFSFVDLVFLFYLYCVRQMIKKTETRTCTYRMRRSIVIVGDIMPRAVFTRMRRTRAVDSVVENL